MTRVLSAEAPAKINRELRVGPRRADGYHDLRSRFASVALADRLEAEEGPRLELSSDSDRVPSDSSNLVVKAAELLAARLAIDARARLRLRKRIPLGAGLGGGSADAAAALRLLLRLWNRTVPDEELAELAAGLGSDVPYFLAGGEADVSGRGERVRPLPDAVPQQDLTLLVPGFALSTAAVYAAFDRLGGAAPPPERLDVERSGGFLGPNDLERAVTAIRPEMAEILAACRRIAREAGMTGSGSAIVLVGAARAEVERLAASIPGARAIATRTTTRAEYARQIAGGEAGA